MGTNLAAEPFVSVEEYIQRFVYGGEKPVCEYIDGVLIPKAMGTKAHATVQMNIAFYIRSLYPSFNPLTELSSRLREGEFHVPDIAVEEMAHPIQGDHPGPGDSCYLCVEVKSLTDRLPTLLAKMALYHSWGVPYGWVIDPITKLFWESARHNPTPREVQRKLTAGEIVLTADQVFDRL
jgi:Uma2 family endonuclease